MTGWAVLAGWPHLGEHVPDEEYDGHGGRQCAGEEPQAPDELAAGQPLPPQYGCREAGCEPRQTATHADHHDRHDGREDHQLPLADLNTPQRPPVIDGPRHERREDDDGGGHLRNAEAHRRPHLTTSPGDCCSPELAAGTSTTDDVHRDDDEHDAQS